MEETDNASKIKFNNTKKPIKQIDDEWNALSNYLQATAFAFPMNTLETMNECSLTYSRNRNIF